MKRYNPGVEIKRPCRCVLELSYDCNLRCKTCNIWQPSFKQRRQITRTLSHEEICRFQADAAAFGINQISYVGGEPLLDKKILKTISQAFKNGLSPAIVTNGTLLDKHSPDSIMTSGLDTLIVSIDGPSHIHDRIRGKAGTFEKVYYNILELQRMKKRKKVKKPKVHIYTTVSRINLHHLASVLDIAQKLDVNALRFQLISVVDEALISQTNQRFHRDMVGNHSYAVDPTLKLSLEEIRLVRETLPRACEWSGITGIKLQVESILENPSKARSCGFVNTSFVITPTGDVLICPMLTDFRIGNLLENCLSDIWGNMVHQTFIHTLTRDGKLPVCSQCCVEKINARA